MNQQKKLESVSTEALMMANVMYEEMLHDVVENIILVSTGEWDKFICNSTDTEIRIYKKWLTEQLQNGNIDEFALRHASLNFMYNGY